MFEVVVRGGCKAGGKGVGATPQKVVMRGECEAGGKGAGAMPQMKRWS